MHFQIIKNPDEEFYKKISAAVEKCNFQCPCFIKNDTNTERLCICQQTRDMHVTGFCHCKRFKMIVTYNEGNQIDTEEQYQAALAKENCAKE